MSNILPGHKTKLQVAQFVRKIYSHEIARWDEDPPNENLGGYCNLASRTLASAFKSKGWNAFVAGNSSHAWVVCDGEIFDITATQFGCTNKVARFPESSIKQHWFEYIRDEEEESWIAEESIGDAMTILRRGNMKNKPYERGAVGRVYSLMKSGGWHSASDIRWAAAATGSIHPASEGLRRMRELRRHGFFIDKRHAPDSVHYQYRLRKPNSKPQYDQSL